MCEGPMDANDGGGVPPPAENAASSVLPHEDDAPASKNG